MKLAFFFFTVNQFVMKLTFPNCKPVHDEIDIFNSKPVRDEIDIFNSKPIRDEIDIS
jgi:hypothetical protein